MSPGPSRLGLLEVQVVRGGGTGRRVKEAGEGCQARTACPSFALSLLSRERNSADFWGVASRSYAYLEGKAFRHGDIEDILEQLAKKAGGGFLGLVSTTRGSKRGEEGRQRERTGEGGERGVYASFSRGAGELGVGREGEGRTWRRDEVRANHLSLPLCVLLTLAASQGGGSKFSGLDIKVSRAEGLWKGEGGWKPRRGRRELVTSAG